MHKFNEEKSWFLAQFFVSSFDKTLINNETINTFSCLLNYHIKKYKISGGYEHLKISSQGFSTIAFGAGFFF